MLYETSSSSKAIKLELISSMHAFGLFSLNLLHPALIVLSLDGMDFSFIRFDSK
jgi:hypothetical protein